jgi:hypothetical protein
MKHQLPIPPTHIYDSRFCYVPAACTNVAETFERIRREMAQQQQQTKRVRRVK